MNIHNNVKESRATENNVIVIVCSENRNKKNGLDLELNHERMHKQMMHKKKKQNGKQLNERPDECKDFCRKTQRSTFYFKNYETH
jgi:hypothetical protein